MASASLDLYVEWASQADRAPAPTTLAAYRNRLQELEDYCADSGLAIERLRRDQLLRYLAPLRTEPDGTSAHRYAALRGFYSFLQMTGRRRDNPMAEVPIPKRPRRRPQPRPGQVSERLGKLSREDRLIADFVREIGDRARMAELFSISEEPPVGPSVTVLDARRKRRELLLTDRARMILDELGGNLGKLRTFQMHLKAVNLTPRQLLRGSRAEVIVELQPVLERRLHSMMAHGQYEAAATEAFKQIEDELKDLVGTGAFGARAIEDALGSSGVLAPGFEREQDREALRMLLLGGIGFYRNNLAHQTVFLEDRMHARELVLFCDLLLRELREAASDLKLRRLEKAPSSERDARMTERQVRALSPLEFQKWVVRRFSGRHAARWSNDMGVDGYTPGHEWPIQAKQLDRVGRPAVDEFETAVERSGKSRGFLVAFGFSKGAQQEAARTRRRGRVDIDLVRVSDLIRAVPD